MMRRNGFTLTELLVVVGILAVLIAVLLPVFFAARQKAHQTACTSNLRQLAAASLMYAQDNDGVLPHVGASNDPNDDWNYQILPYVKTKTLACPMFTLPDDTFFAGYPFQGYAANSGITGVCASDKFPCVQDGNIRYPSATILFLEMNATVKKEGHYDIFGYAVDLSGPALLDKNQIAEGETSIGLQGAVRHSGGSNYAFVDGHVKWHKPDALDWEMQDKNGRDLPPPDGTRPTFRL